MLGGSMNHTLVSRSDPTHLAKLAVAWDTQKYLRFDVPFQDLKPTIYFGKIILILHFLGKGVASALLMLLDLLTDVETYQE
jgi:hypothetical protein